LHRYFKQVEKVVHTAFKSGYLCKTIAKLPK
jgi:hypothetical protein